MSALRAWYWHCVDLFKARKAKDLGNMAKEMDDTLGAWPSEMGSRAEALEHVEKFGRQASLAFKDAKPGTPEHKAFMFMADTKKMARRNSMRNPVLADNDTLTGRLDTAHMKHYAEAFASHHDLLEHSPSALQHDEVEGARAMPVHGGVVQKRALTVEQRNRAMMSEKHSPWHTMEDLDALHAGVQQAIGQGKVSEADANRYVVMRAALQLNAQRHENSYPGLKHRPSWGAIDTTALKVMQIGAEHLPQVGMSDVQQRLSPVLATAMRVHEAHPWLERKQGKGQRDRAAFAYPKLHPLGSGAHAKQEAWRSAWLGQMGKNRNKAGALDVAAHASAAIPAKSAAPAPAASAKAEPTDFSDYQQRRDAGEQFAPAVHVRMERLKRQGAASKMMTDIGQDVNKALLYDAWRLWRGARL